MKIPINWLKEFINIDSSLEKLSEKLLCLGIEVEIKIQRDDEGDDRDEKGQITQQVFFVAVDKDKQKCSGQWEKRNDA